MNRRGLFAALVVLAFVYGVPGRGQQVSPVVIGDAPSCSACRIVFKSKVVVEDEGLLGEPIAVETDGQSRIWIAQTNQMARLYSAQGKFIQELGRKGQGPNEWINPFGFVRLPGDSMLVSDAGTYRTVVVDRNLKAIRTLRFPGEGFPIVPLKWPSLAVLHGVVRIPERTGYLLHLVSFDRSDAVFGKSFGFDWGQKFLPGGASTRFQQVAAAANGSIWTVDARQYRIGMWDAAGNLKQSWVRRPDWFPSVSASGMGSPAKPPPPRIASVRESKDGLLWIVANVASKNWAAGWSRDARDLQELPASMIAREKIFQSIIEVIDPVAQRVLVRQVLDQYVPFVTADGDLVVYSTVPDGSSRITLQALSVERSVR